MIAPACGEKLAPIIRWQAIALVADHARWGFAGAGHHGQGVCEFAIPGGEEVRTAPAIAKPVTVVATRNDLDETTWRATVGVVVHSKHASKTVECGCKRIPESSGQMGQPGSVEL